VADALHLEPTSIPLTPERLMEQMVHEHAK